MDTDKKILNYNNIARVIARRKKLGEKIVFVTGCFDIMHFGHVVFLNYAKKQGDVLVVGLGSDKTLRQLKGKTRPIISENLRARMLAALEVVDYVIILKEGLKRGSNIDCSVVMQRAKPDFYVVPVTDKHLKEKKEVAEKNGGKLKTCKRLPPDHLKGGISTTQILDKLYNTA